MVNVVKKQYHETSENKLAFRELEKKVILSLGPRTKVKGSPNSFFIYETGELSSLFGYVNVSERIIFVKDRKNERKASELAYKINPMVNWTLEGCYFV
jgi:hypothetical protein